MLRTIFALVGALTLAGTSAAAVNAQGWSRQNEDRPPSSRVSFAGLDLGSAAGRKILARRIESAVNRVCGNADLRDLSAVQTELRCRRDAHRSTETQVAQAIDTARRRDMALAMPSTIQTASLR